MTNPDGESPVAEADPKKVGDAPAPVAVEKPLTREVFIAELHDLIARGEAAGLPMEQLTATVYAKRGTRKIVSIFDTLLDSLAGTSK